MQKRGGRESETSGGYRKTADEIFYKAKPKVEALNVDDTGKTADEILYKAEPEAEALNVDDKDPETREELCSSHDQKTVYAETQTTKFEYLSKDKSVLVWKKTTIIIVCFEVFIERPSNLARAQTFSNYKQHITTKVLIAITPQGSICFTSKAWGGRTT